MKIDELIPPPKDKVYFKLSSFKFIPKEAGCYVLTTFDNHILYIGLSDNLFERFQQHLGNSEKTNPTKEGKAIWFYYLRYDSRNLEKLERSWIIQYENIHGRLPILNDVSSPIS